MIEIERITKTFGQGAAAFTALHEVSLEIAENEFFTLLGPSGCGKTTLLRLIAGFEAPSGGTLKLNGADIAHLPPNKRPVNTVFQSYALFPHMTVAENIGFGLEMQGKPRAEVAAAVDEMLALVKMEPMRDRRTSEISGGQQQRVALARALAPHPKVLLLDEPLSALDLKLRKEMQIELKRLQGETGITFIFVTHDQEEALTMSDRIAVMSEGRIHQIGGPREIYDRPETRFVAGFIGDSNFLDVTVTAEGDSGAMARLPCGHAVALPEGATMGRSTLLVRPEHLGIAAPQGNETELLGQIENLVYLGTDTHFHLRLAQGPTLVARRQNDPAEQARFAVGDQVAVEIDGRAVQQIGE
ncbi:Putrescine transport ATP-binding protein PotA [Candidatus Rhodobacter oscarellae]|uniref:Spermidine/putrescine import ATP-binding protein PotA n=1 Tax=Candidatus Rhodobacter oscarellae TaxID=1675527 RepID=A0A0J9EAB5_9RHOB|nr:ABC transporter ATP-binding protein [Candidatus Rhodobacter lobularis]KMW58604.1 Putrescine transport ATP-binding protein PotA [Candidatus Rhodobacter lobularis]